MPVGPLHYATITFFVKHLGVYQGACQHRVHDARTFHKPKEADRYGNEGPSPRRADHLAAATLVPEHRVPGQWPDFTRTAFAHKITTFRSDQLRVPGAREFVDDGAAHASSQD